MATPIFRVTVAGSTCYIPAAGHGVRDRSRRDGSLANPFYNDPLYTPDTQCIARTKELLS